MSDTEMIQQFAADLVRRVKTKAHDEVRAVVESALHGAWSQIQAKMGQAGPLPNEWAEVAQAGESVVKACGARVASARLSAIRERLAAGGEP